MIFIMLTSSRKNLEMTEIVHHSKVGPRLLGGKIDTVMKNLFFYIKIRLKIVLKVNF